MHAVSTDRLCAVLQRLTGVDLWRIKAAESEINRLRSSFDRENPPELASDDATAAVTSVLLQFLKEIPGASRLTGAYFVCVASADCSSFVSASFCMLLLVTLRLVAGGLVDYDTSVALVSTRGRTPNVSTCCSPGATAAAPESVWMLLTCYSGAGGCARTA